MSFRLKRLVSARLGNPGVDLTPQPTVLPQFLPSAPVSAVQAPVNIPFQSVFGPLPLGSGMAVAGEDLSVNTSDLGNIDSGVLPQG